VPVRSWVLLFLGLLFLTPQLAAQTQADSANTVLDAARILQREGRDDAARQLLLFIRTRYGATPAARAADSLLGTLPHAISASTVARSGSTNEGPASRKYLIRLNR